MVGFSSGICGFALNKTLFESLVIDNDQFTSLFDNIFVIDQLLQNPRYGFARGSCHIRQILLGGQILYDNLIILGKTNIFG